MVVKIAQGLWHDHSFHPGKANIVVDVLSRLSIRSTVHLEEEKKELAQEVYRLARLGVQLMDYTKRGIMVTNGVELSLVSKVKEKQDQDPILLELKACPSERTWWINQVLVCFEVLQYGSRLKMLVLTVHYDMNIPHK